MYTSIIDPPIQYDWNKLNKLEQSQKIKIIWAKHTTEAEESVGKKGIRWTIFVFVFVRKWPWRVSQSLSTIYYLRLYIKRNFLYRLPFKRTYFLQPRPPLLLLYVINDNPLSHRRCREKQLNNGSTLAGRKN